MKKEFPGFYSPSTKEYERLLKEGLIVLDTNVLLDLYRLPAMARDELLGVLEGIKDRLWIPFQVALEFQRRRLTVIAGERKTSEGVVNSTEKLVADLQQKIEALQIDKRALGFKADDLIKELRSTGTKLKKAVETVHLSQVDIAAADTVRDRIDEIFLGRVGPSPSDQADLDRLMAGGDDRYSRKIPPGFEDIDKDKDPNNATYIHNSLEYKAKFGDLIFWRQLLDHVKAGAHKEVMLVTSEKKDDWWRTEFGRTIGPHPELINEIQREASAELFWMYSPSQFLRQVQEHTKAKVSAESIAEFEQIVAANASYDQPIRQHEIMPRAFRSAYPSYARVVPAQFEEVVAHWLSSTGQAVEISPYGFPDIIVRDHEGKHGYEVKFTRNPDRMPIGPIANAILRGNLEVAEGKIRSFSLVLVVPEEAVAEFSIDQFIRLEQRIQDQIGRDRCKRIIIGYISGSSFEVLIENDYSS